MSNTREKEKKYQLKCDISIYPVYGNNQKGLPFQIKALPIKGAEGIEKVFESFLEFIMKVL
jgi:hypothetical protein